MFEGHAIEKLHSDESAAVFFADVVNRARCWDGSTLTRLSASRRNQVPRPGDPGPVPGQRIFRATKRSSPYVLGLIDHAHAAFAQLLDECGNARWFLPIIGSESYLRLIGKSTNVERFGGPATTDCGTSFQRTIAEQIALQSAHNPSWRGTSGMFMCRFAKLRQVVWLREGTALPRPQPQLVHGTVPQKCARNTTSSTVRYAVYRPALGELHDRPPPISST